MSWRRAAAVAVLPWLALMGALVAVWQWEENWTSLPWGTFLLISATLYAAVTGMIHSSGKLFPAKPEKPE